MGPPCLDPPPKEALAADCDPDTASDVVTSAHRDADAGTSAVTTYGTDASAGAIGAANVVPLLRPSDSADASRRACLRSAQALTPHITRDDGSHCCGSARSGERPTVGW